MADVGRHLGAVRAAALMTKFAAENSEGFELVASIEVDELEQNVELHESINAAMRDCESGLLVLLVNQQLKDDESTTMIRRRGLIDRFVEYPTRHVVAVLAGLLYWWDEAAFDRLSNTTIAEVSRLLGESERDATPSVYHAEQVSIALGRAQAIGWKEFTKTELQVASILAAFVLFLLLMGLMDLLTDDSTSSDEGLSSLSQISSLFL